MYNHLGFVLLLSFIGSNSTTLALAGTACDVASCGQGTCKASSSILGFECECRAGWKKPHIGFLTFPTCTVPNCSVSYQCGTSHTPSPSPPPPPPPAFDLFDPCSLAWCGQGRCIRDGSDFSCKCDPGYVNFSNSTTSTCLQQCYLGTDCAELGIAIDISPPTSPPQSDSDSRNGSSGMLRCSWILKLLSVLLTTTMLSGCLY